MMKMNIGILTFHRAHNCGAMLQAWALWRVLSKLGHDVSFPDVNHVGEESGWPSLWRKGFVGKLRNLFGWIVSLWRTNFAVFRARHAFTSFRRKWLRVCSCDISELHKTYDLLMIGSDQVWSERCAGTELPLFLGENISPELPLVGYAVSVGDELPSKSALDRLRGACRHRYRAVSCREKMLSSALGDGVETVCDPTLLLGREDYRMLERPVRLVKEQYVFLYGISDVGSVWPVALRFAQEKNLVLVTAGFCSSTLARHSRVKMFTTATPDIFLTLMRDADYVFASSFHGCAFSIIYHKHFLNLYGNETKNPEGRQQNLLGKLGLSSHRLPYTALGDDICRVIEQDYDVGIGLQAMQKAARAFLQGAIG